MSRYTGVNSKTAKRLIIDSGTLFVNYGDQDERKLGATNEGVTFAIEQSIRAPEIDGLPGPLAGTRRITSSIARMTFSLMEQTVDNLKLEIAGAEVDSEATEPNHDVIRREGYYIPTGTHVKNVALIGRVTGTNKPIVILLYNALSDSEELSFAMEDENEVQPEIQMTAHFTASELDKEPWEIRYPKFSQFTLTYTAGENGSITGDSPQTVEQGDDGAAVTAEADSGFVFDGWDDGVETATRRDTFVQDDITVEAQFVAE